jgi:hypothetical protein
VISKEQLSLLTNEKSQLIQPKPLLKWVGNKVNVAKVV